MRYRYPNQIGSVTMYGTDYLDWTAETAAERAIDAFLTAMEPEDRKWALAVLRKRHVTYRDSGLSQLGRGASDGLQAAMDRQRQRGQPHFGPSGPVSSLVSALGL